VLRWLMGSLCVLAVCGLLAAAEDKDRKDKNDKDRSSKSDKDKGDKKSKDQKEAKITKVDARKGTVTVKMKDKEGKEAERTFTLAEDVEYLDSTGRVARLDVFTSGDYVLIVEAEGKVKQMKKDDHHKGDKDKTGKAKDRAEKKDR